MVIIKIFNLSCLIIFSSLFLQKIINKSGEVTMSRKTFCFVFLFLCVSQIVGQNGDKYKKISWRVYHSTNWRDYVDYQSDEWKNMPIEEKDALLQIPIEELKTMSTKELIEASVNCLFARGIGRFSGIDNYYEEIYNKFNGFRELTARNDVCKSIIEYYEIIDLRKEILSTTDSSFKYQVQRLEHLIGHPIILEKFNPVEINQLIFLLKEKYFEKASILEFTDHDQISTVYALAKLLERKDELTKQQIYGIKNIDMLLHTGTFLTKDVRDQILSIAK